VANPDDVVPDLPALPARSEFSYWKEAVPRDLRPNDEAEFPGQPASGSAAPTRMEHAARWEACPGMFVLLSGRWPSAARMRSGQYPHLERRGGSIYGEVDSSRSRCLWTSSPRPVEDCCPPSGGDSGLLVASRARERILRSLTSAGSFRSRSLWRPGSHWSAPPFPDAGAREFLSAAHPHQVLDPETDSDARAGRAPRRGPDDLPLLSAPGGSVLKNPGDIAWGGPEACQLNPERGYDVHRGGGAPAGLATAAMRIGGLSVLVIDGRASGVKASASARSKNYSLCTGITARTRRARFHPGQKFGADFAMSRRCNPAYPSSAEARDPHLLVLEDGGPSPRAPSSSRRVRATSSSIRRWPISEARRSPTGLSIELGAAGKGVVLVGGGNSAGTGSGFPLGPRCPRALLIRGSTLSQSIRATLWTGLPPPPTPCPPLDESPRYGNERGSWRSPVEEPAHRTRERANVRHVFLFVGADPATEWLGAATLRSMGGFGDGVDLTLQELVRAAAETSDRWRRAAGVSHRDVRCGSVKRIGGAIGEGRRWWPSSTPTWPSGEQIW